MFIVVAIVIFGIFVGLAYTTFGSQGLSSDLKFLFEQPLTKVTDYFDGVKTRQLVDINTIYEGMVNGTAIINKDLTNSRVTLTTVDSGNSGGISIPTRSLTSENKKYILTFDATLESGTFTHIGGHIGGRGTLKGDGVTDVVIKINGLEVKPEVLNMANNDWYNGVPVPEGFTIGDTISVEVSYFRNYFSTDDYADNPIKIQPNRTKGQVRNGYGVPYRVVFSKISMLEIDD